MPGYQKRIFEIIGVYGALYKDMVQIPTFQNYVMLKFDFCFLILSVKESDSNDLFYEFYSKVFLCAF